MQMCLCVHPNAALPQARETVGWQVYARWKYSDLHALKATWLAPSTAVAGILAVRERRDRGHFSAGHLGNLHT
jgi:hypothetical protein